MTGSEPIAVIGAGAFGTALAAVAAAKSGADVTLIGRDESQIANIESTRENRKALAGIPLPQGLAVSHDLASAKAARRILVAVPSQAVGAVVAALQDHAVADAELIICAKGLERSSSRFLADVVADAAPGRPVTVLSGPGFAADIAKGLPTAMTIANASLEIAEASALALSSETFRLYASDDVVGVEVGGALKNVLAIASGIVDGAGIGQSARAALIARGLSEMGRFADAHGARAETVSGLSGLGDLVLTATSTQSRNFRFGHALGEGAAPDGLIKPGEPLVEGAFTAEVAARIARERQIDMPITSAVAAIIAGKLSVEAAVSALMRRPLRTERY